MITNPAPAQIASGEWDVEPGINKFTVSIPTRPDDNDLAGIIVLAKEGTGQTLTFPDDIFYRGPWSDMIVVDTDDDNQALLPNQAYTVAVAAFDEFGTDSLTFSATKNVTTAQVQTNDIANSAVTNAKIDSVVADKITAGTITGSTLQTASSGKRFVVSQANNEAYFYNDADDLVVSIGENSSGGDDYLVILDGELAGINGLRVTASSGDTAISSRATNTAVEGDATATTDAGWGGYFLGNQYGIYVRAGSNTGGSVKPTAAYIYSSNGFSDAPVTHIVQAGNVSTGPALKIEVTGSGSSSKAIQVSSGNSDLSGGVVYFKSYTVSTLPSASTAGGMIYVSNESGGAVMAFSDGTNWRRVTDRAIVS